MSNETSQDNSDDLVLHRAEFDRGWTEAIHNGEPIRWDHWAMLSNITSQQAAKLSYHIDPIVWPNDSYAEGKLRDDLRAKIEHLAQWLESQRNVWDLADLCAALAERGEVTVPLGMQEVASTIIATKTNKPQMNNVEQERNSGNKRERQLTTWLRETWIKEGKPKANDFFKVLKNYVNKPNSPIVEHFTSSQNGPGIRWKIDSGKKGIISKKTIQNTVGKFKKEPQ